MNRAGSIALVIVSLVVGSCCVKTPEPTVHVVGYYNTGAENVAAYWKDDAASVVPLYDLDAAQATCVTVSGSDVYVAGHYINAAGNRAAAYWKNGGLPIPLYSDTTGTNDALANSIAVSGSNVYVAGWINEGPTATTKSAVVWKNGTPTALWGTSESEGIGVTVSGTDVYVTGYYTSLGKKVACWWKNDDTVRTDLYTSNSAKGLGVAVSGSDVYVAGYYLDPSAKTCYWKRALAGMVDLGASGQATSVFVSGSDVYVAGYYENAKGNWSAAYWKNGGLPVDLYSDTTGTNTALAYSIFVADGVVYAAGYVNEGTQVACYWKDGARVALYPGVTSQANSLWVE